MKTKLGRTLSRREFAQRAAMLSATASLIPAEVIRPQAPPSAPQQTAPSQPKLTNAGQAEAESRYQQILSLYSEHLDDTQKANIKRMCEELQPSLERIRSFRLQNGDVPALYLKPLVERDKKPQPPSTSQPGAPSKPGASPAKQ
jgi:hypothetical protein